MRKSNPAIPLDAARTAWEAGGTKSDGDTWRPLSCKLVTPLYGGGVRAGEVDEFMPARSSSIRGQLRFWWRLLYGMNQPSEAVFAAETAIWGGITHSGPISSKVAMRVKAKPVRSADLAAKSQLVSFPAYALIIEPGADPRLLLAGYGFDVALRFASDLDADGRAQVEQALRWWASFGGIGARTRRGLGAVEVEGLDPVTPAEVAERGGWLILGTPGGDVANAWAKSVEALQRFRQGPNLGRNPGDGNRPGRSLWPEADTLRELCGHALPKHEKRQVPGQVFPRAVFGLPIVFHFKNAASKRDHQTKGFDPDDHVLEPADLSAQEPRDRMASPLILRPYWSGQQWQPAALLLPGWQRALGVPLKFKGQHYTPVPWPTDPHEARNLADQIKPMQGRGIDPLTAFMDYFEKGRS